MAIIDKKEEFETRQFINTFVQLLGKVDCYWEKVLKNPIPFMKAAEQKIVEQQKTIEEIKDLYRADTAVWSEEVPKSEDSIFDTICVPKEDYERMLKLEKVVRKLD